MALNFGFIGDYVSHKARVMGHINKFFVFLGLGYLGLLEVI